jgi:hypothetical protein
MKTLSKKNAFRFAGTATTLVLCGAVIVSPVVWKPARVSFTPSYRELFVPCPGTPPTGYLSSRFARRHFENAPVLIPDIDLLFPRKYGVGTLKQPEEQPQTYSAPRIAFPAESKYLDNMETQEIVRAPDHRVSMKEEMTTLADYDYGRWRAMTAQNPADREKVRGFVSISAVWSVQLAPPVPVRRASIMLAEAVNRYTDMTARVDTHLTLDARRLFSTPFLYITADRAFELTPTERNRLGEYLRSGGFAFLDTGVTEYEHGPGEASLRQMLRDALGCHARFAPIPLSHPIYHCFFEFTDGAPQGSEVQYLFTSTLVTEMCGWTARNARLPRSEDRLEGVFLDGGLVAVYSAKGYGKKWVQWWNNNDPQLKFGVNLVVYALTREGGITARVMERFSDVQ